MNIPDVVDWVKLLLLPSAIIMKRIYMIHAGLIQEDGEDILITIPDEILDAAGLKAGDPINIQVKNGSLVITPIEKGNL